MCVDVKEKEGLWGRASTINLRPGSLSYLSSRSLRPGKRSTNSRTMIQRKFLWEMIEIELLVKNLKQLYRMRGQSDH